MIDIDMAKPPLLISGYLWRNHDGKDLYWISLSIILVFANYVWNCENFQIDHDKVNSLHPDVKFWAREQTVELCTYWHERAIVYTVHCSTLVANAMGRKDYEMTGATAVLAALALNQSDPLLSDTTNVPTPLFCSAVYTACTPNPAQRTTGRSWRCVVLSNKGDSDALISPALSSTTAFLNISSWQ